MINLFNLALPIIHTVTDAAMGVFKYRSMEEEKVNKIGVKVPSFSDWVTCQGEVQPVQRSRYEALGLDWSKNYINVWGSVIIQSLTEVKQPDQILWRGMLWNVTSVNEWNPQDGWVNVTAVQDKRYTGNK